MRSARCTDDSAHRVQFCYGAIWASYLASLDRSGLPAGCSVAGRIRMCRRDSSTAFRRVRRSFQS